jgi:uncharacterized membrane protein
MVFLLIAILVFASQYFLHWQIWAVATISYVVASVFGKTAWGVFFSAFFAVFLVWSGMAFWQDIQNDQLLSGRIAQMLAMPATGEWFFVITGVVGGVLSAIAALAGYYLKRLFIKAVPTTPTTGK